jgi:microcystin-dependent protein
MTMILDGDLGATNPNGSKTSAPIGSVIDFAGDTPPVDYLALPIVQTNISRTTYAELFAAIGTKWGAGDGSTTFGMPWMPAGYATIQANGNVGSQTVGDNLEHTHVQNAHSHTQRMTSNGAGSANRTYGGTGVNGTTNSVDTTLGATATNQNQGSEANFPAGAYFLKCIKYR